MLFDLLYLSCLSDCGRLGHFLTFFYLGQQVTQLVVLWLQYSQEQENIISLLSNQTFQHIFQPIIDAVSDPPQQVQNQPYITKYQQSQVPDRNISPNYYSACFSLYTVSSYLTNVEAQYTPKSNTTPHAPQPLIAQTNTYYPQLQHHYQQHSLQSKVYYYQFYHHIQFVHVQDQMLLLGNVDQRQRCRFRILGELFECVGDCRLNRGSFPGLGCRLVGCRLGFVRGLWLWRICGGFLGFAYV